ncbi:zinc finger protein, partial [Cricetulus griseus]
DSHVDQEEGKNCTGAGFHDPGHADSQYYTAGPEVSTDCMGTSSSTKELRQGQKGKGPLLLQILETMRNTVSSDPSLSAFHPVIRKRPRSSFLLRAEKAKRHLDMSLLLEENVDCCLICSGVAARSSGPGPKYVKPKRTGTYAEPTGPSSSDQRELVNSPSNQTSLKTTPFTVSKSVSGMRVTSASVHGRQRSSKYLEGKPRRFPSPEQDLISFSCSKADQNLSISPERKLRQAHTDQAYPKSTNLEPKISKQFPFANVGLTNNFTPVKTLKSLSFHKENPHSYLTIQVTIGRALVPPTSEGGLLDDTSPSEKSVNKFSFTHCSFGSLQFTQVPITLSIPADWTYKHMPYPEEVVTHTSTYKVGPRLSLSRRRRWKHETTAQGSLSRSKSEHNALNWQKYDPQTPCPALKAKGARTANAYNEWDTDGLMATSESPDISSSSKEAQVNSKSTGGALASSTMEGGAVANAFPTERAVDLYCCAPDTLQPFQFNKGTTELSIPVHGTLRHMPSQVEELTHSPSIKEVPRPSSSMKSRIQQNCKKYDPQTPSPALQDEEVLTRNTYDEWDTHILLGTSESPETTASSKEVHIVSRSTGEALPSSTFEGGVLVYFNTADFAVDRFCSITDSFQPLQFNQGTKTQSITVEWMFTNMPSQNEEMTHFPYIKEDPRQGSSMKSRIQQAATAQGSLNSSDPDDIRARNPTTNNLPPMP